MTTHRFILAPYKGTNTRHTCPACGRRREFARYIDTDTNTEPQVGDVVYDKHLCAGAGRLRV